MLTITRRQAQQLRSVLRRAFGTRSHGPVVGFTADAEGLTVRSVFADVAVVLRLPGAQPNETLWLPIQALDDFAGKKDDPVELEAIGGGRVTIRWRDRDGQQLTKHEAQPPRDVDRFPTMPAALAENPSTLLKAFTEVSEIADPSSARYALGNVRLRGEDGSLAATDGRQLLYHRGFRFPWEGDVLVSHSKLFSAAELSTYESVTIGKADDWIAFGIGPWTIYMREARNGHYPKVEQVIPAADKAIGTCRFSAADAKFLAVTLPRLPMEDGNSNSLTLDLNGQVVVRAKGADQSPPTEVVCNGSVWSGKPVRLNVNGKQMLRAMKSGLCELRVISAASPISWQDDTQTYVTAAFPSDCCVESSTDAVRIESPKVEASVAPIISPTPKPKTERIKRTVSEPTANTTGRVSTEPTTTKPRRRKTSQQDIAKLVDQAIKFRAATHNLMHEAGELVKALKAHRRTSKAIQNALSTINQVKSLI